MKKRKKSNSNIKFIFLFYFFVFLVTFFIYKPDDSTLKSQNNITIEEISKEKKKKEFKFIVNLLKNDYPYLQLYEETTNNTLNNLISEYENLVLATENDIDYEKTISSFLNEFQQSNLKLLSADDFYKYKKYSNTNIDSPWTLVLNDENVIARYKEYKDNSNSIPSDSGISMESLNEGKVAYINIPDFNPLSVNSDSQIIKEFLDTLSKYQFLIIDIRDNKGTSIEYVFENIIKPLANNTLVMKSTILQKNKNYSSFLDYFNKYDYLNIDNNFSSIDKLSNDTIDSNTLKNFSSYKKYNIKFTKNENNTFNGEIYILQNNNTENSADFLSQFSNITNFASTVGQFTKGNGINLSSVFIKLPYSHFVISAPIGMGINEEGTINAKLGTYPKIPVNENLDSLEVLLDKLK